MTTGERAIGRDLQVLSLPTRPRGHGLLAALTKTPAGTGGLARLDDRFYQRR